MKTVYLKGSQTFSLLNSAWKLAGRVLVDVGQKHAREFFNKLLVVSLGNGEHFLTFTFFSSCTFSSYGRLVKENKKQE